MQIELPDAKSDARPDDSTDLLSPHEHAVDSSVFLHAFGEPNSKSFSGPVLLSSNAITLEGAFRLSDSGPYGKSNFAPLLGGYAQLSLSWHVLCRS